ncbi:MAG: signal recognition particle-docking protein FtsY [Alphaproteobacteria bacterium]
MISFFSNFKKSLFKTSSRLNEHFFGIFKNKENYEKDVEKLEEILIQNDLGIQMAKRLCCLLKEETISFEDVKKILIKEIISILSPFSCQLILDPKIKTHVICFVGANGSGKTTTIAKMAKAFIDKGNKVAIAACDTFRAAAVEQLSIWGNAIKCPIYKSHKGADAAGVAYDAFLSAKNQNIDLLFVDTAGRLPHNEGLIMELQKIMRVLKKIDINAPHHTFLVADSTVGQSTRNHIDLFKKAVPISGFIMTKLDGTAKGGIIVDIVERFKIPVYGVGVGEKIDDFYNFDPKSFAESIIR